MAIGPWLKNNVGMPAAPTSNPISALPPIVLASLAATWLVWGSTYLAIKFALESFPPFYQMGTRFLTAGVLLAFWMKARGAPWPNLRQWGHALVVGSLMLGGGMGGTASAEVTVSSGLVVAFIAVIPFLTALANMVWRDFPTRWEWAGIALGLVGVLMLVRGSGFAGSSSGLIAISVAVVCWTLGSVLSQRNMPLAPGAMGFASEMICGGVVLMALSLLTSERPTWPPSPQAAYAWVYLVIFGSLIGFNAYMLLLSRTSPALATSYSFVNPVIAMLLGVALGGERVTSWEWAAAGVVVLGVVVLVLSKRPARHAHLGPDEAAPTQRNVRAT
jgi:drug/metabolite transporter (DMT)-like permease